MHTVAYGEPSCGLCKGAKKATYTHNRGHGRYCVSKYKKKATKVNSSRPPPLRATGKICRYRHGNVEKPRTRSRRCHILKCYDGPRGGKKTGAAVATPERPGTLCDHHLPPTPHPPGPVNAGVPTRHSAPFKKGGILYTPRCECDSRLRAVLKICLS
jgi:hypothetical protein